jgi:hypothetical protein
MFGWGELGAWDEGFGIQNNLKGRGVWYPEQPLGARGLVSRTTFRGEGFGIQNNL